MKILLFDWTADGHHPAYVRSFAGALAPRAEIVVAAPDGMSEELGDLPAEVVRLGQARPPTDFTRRLAPQNRSLGEEEVERFAEAVSRVRPGRAVHLYADPVIRRLVKRPDLGVPTTLCVFFPRAHYPAAYGSPLSARERAQAAFKEYLIARWRRRRDAHALMSLDEEAVRRWSSRRGAPAFWLPEPPVEVPLELPAPRERSGCVLFGALARRKGIDLLAQAVTLEPSSLKVLLAGAVESGFEVPLRQHVSRMERAGARVELRTGRLSVEAGMRALGEGRCAVLPYPRHFGMSRVLLEAAAAGTPTVVHDHGLLGHLVRKHGLGASVDCTDARALRRALHRYADDPDAVAAHAEALARFVAHYSDATFEQAVRAPFGLAEPRMGRGPAQVAQAMGGVAP
jgi:hypothetical protein